MPAVSPTIAIRFIRSIDAVNQHAWNALVGSDYPFLRHEFLAALEHSGCTNASTGWQPLHVLVERGEQLLGVLPLYSKTDSFGEYVFDWSWADAYKRHGLPYYPKLVTAIPFTPCAGPRLVIAAEVALAEVLPMLQQALTCLCEQEHYSGWHVLFPQEPLRDALQQQGHLLRTGCQYQWFNQEYRSFDDYLATFASRKRKNLRKERQSVQDAGIELRTIEGAAITANEWQQFYQFYAHTYLVRGRRPYLNPEFFELLLQRMPEQLLLVLAEREQQAIAGALFFKGSDTLYGRYWGASADVPNLHFEVCYYQGIEYCIHHQLQRMDSGAQGEHKIQRGFAPVATRSTHWIHNTDFRHAIGQFLVREQSHVQEYMQQASDLLPFRQANNDNSEPEFPSTL